MQLSLSLLHCIMRVCSHVCFLYQRGSETAHSVPSIQHTQEKTVNGKMSLLSLLQRIKLPHCAKILLSQEWTEGYIEENWSVPEKYPRCTLGRARKQHIWHYNLTENLPWLSSWASKKIFKGNSAFYSQRCLCWENQEDRWRLSGIFRGFGGLSWSRKSTDQSELLLSLDLESTFLG